MKTVPTPLRLLVVLLLAATFAVAGSATLRAQDATPEPTEEVETTVTADVTVTEEATEETTGAAPTATVGAGVTTTEEATTPVQGRPVHVHAGTCDELGEVVAPLTDLLAAGDTADDTDEADADGVDDADATEESSALEDLVNGGGPIPVEVSFTTIDLSLDEIEAADHAINAHLSYDEIETYVACGEIGGTRLSDGALAIGLHEQDDSGFAGIAYLAPNAADPSQTDVSVFLAEGLIDDDGQVLDPTTGDDSDDSDDAGSTDDEDGSDLEEVTPDATEESESDA